MKRLFEEYGDSILRMCLLYLKDYQLAEDATQETFIKVLKSYESFQGMSSEKTWIISIAVNCCKNIRRTRWFQSCRNEIKEVVGLEEKSFEKIIEKTDISNAISKLKTSDRELIILYYYQELSMKEISEIIHKSENTTIQKVNRARNRLKNILLEAGYEK